MSTGPRARVCGWSSGRSTSASTANSWSAWPATPSEIFDEIRAFDYYLGGTFAALGIVLLLTTIFQVRFGLAPLKRISESIADIRSGRAERLEGEFPGRDRAAGARDQRADRRQPRDRRARAHPCRQSRPRHQDAAVGHRQRGFRPRGRSLCQQGAGAGRCDARSGGASSGARAHRRARHHRRHRHRGRARHRGAAADHGKDPSGSRHHHRGEGRSRGASFAASARTSRRWPAIWSTTPANGRPRRSSSRCWWSRRRSPVPGRGCGSSSMTTAADCPPPSARRCRGAASGWTNPSRGPGSGFRSWSISPRLYGGSLVLGDAPIGGLRAELVLPGV